MMKQKTIRDVVEQDGKPVVERLSNGKFDVLCYGNDGSCKGCKYHKLNCLNCCIAQCKDEDHIHWIHFKPVSSLNGTRVKQASEFDKLITRSGKKFTIVARSKFEFDVEPDEI